MKWITRDKVKVDRAACPRLIKPLYGYCREMVRQGRPDGVFAA